MSRSWFEPIVSEFVLRYLKRRRESPRIKAPHTVRNAQRYEEFRVAFGSDADVQRSLLEGDWPI